RYRLRRLAEYTGRSLDDPRWIAELGLAYQIELADEVNAV
ncbi:helix-turn-helix domain-containing protein, partial [Mycobacterium sp.]